MAGSTATKKPTLRSQLSRSPELAEVARQLASLALAYMEQDGRFSVRQREQLRRALAVAGDERGWSGAAVDRGDPSKEFLALGKSGTKATAKDVANELAMKKTELSRLEKTIASIRKLEGKPDTAFPVEIPYTFTARDAVHGLVTKTETVTVNNEKEAVAAGDSLEKTITSRTKLADLMTIDLKQKQKKLEKMAPTLPDFVKASQELLAEVMVNLQ
jgi:hypothetical protein